MKVKPLKHNGEERVKFWCPGCGQFHDVLAFYWNGDKESPSLKEQGSDTAKVFVFQRDERVCHVSVWNGVIAWGSASTHQRKGTNAPMQHEESWRDDGKDWHVKPPNEAKQA